MNLRDTTHGQDFAVRLASELVGAVAGADGDRQGIHAGGFDKRGCLLRVGEQLVVRQLAFRAVPVFFLAVPRLERTQAAQFAFDGDAPRVRQLTTSEVTWTL